MQTTSRIITPAEDISLLTLYEARLALNLTSSNEMLDDQIELMIKWASAEIATLCNRTFARETLVETVSEIGGDSSGKLYLSHWPVVEIAGISEDGGADLVEDDDYVVDTGSGVITRLGTPWTEAIEVEYTGGYNLPFEAPVALQQAALLMTREAYYATVRGDATVRMVSHKDSRIIYFDPNAKSAAAAGGGGGMGGSPARRAVGDLLKHFIRFAM